MKYLLNKLQFYKEQHSDALCPAAPEPQVSLLGEHSITKTATAANMHAMHKLVSNSLHNVKGSLHDITTTLTAMSSRLMDSERRAFFPSIVTLQCSHANAAAHIGQGQQLNSISMTNSIEFSTDISAPNPLPASLPQIMTTTLLQLPPNTQYRHHTNHSLPSPQAGICIPDVPVKHNEQQDCSTALADILFHWENADPLNCLTML